MDGVGNSERKPDWRLVTAYVGMYVIQKTFYLKSRYSILLSHKPTYQKGPMTHEVRKGFMISA